MIIEEALAKAKLDKHKRLYLLRHWKGEGYSCKGRRKLLIIKVLNCQLLTMKNSREFQSNTDDEKIKLKRGNITDTQLKFITILLSSSSNISEHGCENFEINISYTFFNNPHFNTLFKDSIEYKEFLIGNGCNSITEIKIPQQYNIYVKNLKMKSIESEPINNKTIPFRFLLKDPKHVIIQSTQNSKTEFVVLTWKIIINKINLNWIRFGFFS